MLHIIHIFFLSFARPTAVTTSEAGMYCRTCAVPSGSLYLGVTAVGPHPRRDHSMWTHNVLEGNGCSKDATCLLPVAYPTALKQTIFFLFAITPAFVQPARPPGPLTSEHGLPKPSDPADLPSPHNASPAAAHLKAHPRQAPCIAQRCPPLCPSPHVLRPG